MTEERLRFSAELRDTATPGLKQLRAELSAIRATPGMQAATKWFKEFQGVSKGFLEAAGGSAGAFAAMGVGGLTAAASIGQLVRSMNELKDRQLAIKELGREVGMTTDQLNVWAHAGQNFSVSSAAMGSAVNHLAGQMPEFRRNLGPLMQELGRWPQLIKKLQQEGTSDQLKDIFNFLGSDQLQKEPQLQKKLADAFFGNGDEMEKLLAKGPKAFLDEWDKAAKQLQPISPELLKQEDKFRESMTTFNRSLENFENSAGPKFLAMLTAIVDQATRFFDSLNATPPRVMGRGAVAPHSAEWPPKAWRDAHEAPDQSAPQLRLPPPRGPMDRGNSLLHKSSFESDVGGAPFGLVKTIAEGTKVGFLGAYRELTAGTDTSGNGIVPAAYHPDGGGGGLSGGLNSNWRHGLPPKRGYGGGSDAGTSSNAHNLTDLIRQEADRAGVDPRILEGIRAGESGHGRGYDHNAGTPGHPEDSWGPFQLNRRGGLGAEFERDTGLNLSDPRTIPAQTRWVANYIKRHGTGSLSQWRGFRGPRDADPRWGDAGYVPNAGTSGVVDKGAGAGGDQGITDISGMSTYRRQGEHVEPEAFVFHHTGGRGTPQGVVNTLNQRGLGIQFVMDRDGKIYKTLPDGSRGAHILGTNVDGHHYGNDNTWGMEVIAKDDKDVTPAEVESGKRFFEKLKQRFPNIQAYGHGYLNPGHKQATEGSTITNAIRQMERVGALPARDPVMAAQDAAKDLPVQDRGFLGAYSGRDRHGGSLTSSHPPATHGQVDVHVHIHGNAAKSIVKTKGSVQAKLRRWPTMPEASDHA